MEIDLSITAKTFAAFPEALDLLGLSSALENKHKRRLAITGLLDCLPLALIDDAQQIVIRADVDPEVAEPRIAIAHIVAGESMLISSNASTFIPIWITMHLVNVTEAEWNAWMHLPSDSWHTLVEFHATLGGKDELETIHTLLSNKEIRASLCQDLSGRLWSESLADAFEIAAPTDDRGRFQRTLRSIFKEDWISDLDIGSFRSWRLPLDKSLGVFGNPPNPNLLFDLLINANRRPCSHDSGWSLLNGVGDMFGSAAEESGASILAARALVERAPADWKHSLAKAIRALANKGSEYDGRTHLNSLNQLVNERNGVDAWQAALTSCFWTYKRLGKVPAEMMMMMRRLAQDLSPDYLWPIVAHNLEVMGVTG